MPLSEHEQRLLEEMERNLYKNEADVVNTSDFRRTPNYTAIAVGVLMGLVGIATMVVGVSSTSPWWGFWALGSSLPASWWLLLFLDLRVRVRPLVATLRRRRARQRPHHSWIVSTNGGSAESAAKVSRPAVED